MSTMTGTTLAAEARLRERLAAVTAAWRLGEAFVTGATRRKTGKIVGPRRCNARPPAPGIGGSKMPTHRTRVPRVCEYCGAVFLRKPSDVAMGYGRFCSRPCYSASFGTREMRFWAKVDKAGPVPAHRPELGPCWIWTAALSNNDGYGSFGDGKGGSTTAHRVAWGLAGGAIPPGLQVLHVCDNPACVRNDSRGTYEVDGREYVRLGHLWLASHAVNMADMRQKGRSGLLNHPERAARGDRNGSVTHPERQVRGERVVVAKLTEDAVRTIREAYAAGRGSMKSIGLAYGVGKQTISAVVRRKTWAHVR